MLSGILNIFRKIAFFNSNKSSPVARIIGTANYYKLLAYARVRVWNSGQAIPPNFDNDDRVLIYLYTHQTLHIYHYKSINSVLRGEYHPDSAELLNLAHLLRKALLKLPPLPGMFTRVSYLSLTILLGHQAGEVVCYPSFTSTSLKRMPVSNHSVRYTIIGRTGRHIAKFSRFPKEEEVLFPSGTSFRVLQVDREPDITHIIMEEV